MGPEPRLTVSGDERVMFQRVLDQVPTKDTKGVRGDA